MAAEGCYLDSGEAPVFEPSTGNLRVGGKSNKKGMGCAVEALSI